MTKSNSQISSLIAALLLFLFMHPYFMWGAGKYFNIVFSFLLFALFAINIDLNNGGRKLLFVFFTIMVMYDPYLQGLNINGFLISLLVCTLPFSKSFFTIKTFDYLLTIYSIVIAISGIIWILSLARAVPVLGVIAPWNSLKDISYIHYPLLVVPNESGFHRFEGVFDEPGVVGTLSAFLLTIGKFNLKDKRFIIVLITGLMSMSFFFYVVVLVYYAFFYFLHSKQKIYGVLLIMLFALFYGLTYDNKIMYEVLWSRFEWDSTSGTFAGDNRTGLLVAQHFDSIVGTREFYTGIAHFDEIYEDLLGSSSIILSIMRYGIIFNIIYITFFLMYGLRYKKDWPTYLFFAFVFLGTIYQRPSLFDPVFLFCFSLMATNYYRAEVSIRTKL